MSDDIKLSKFPYMNPYYSMIESYNPWVMNELEGVKYKNNWCNFLKKNNEHMPIDLEIGTGSGFHFARRAKDLSRSIVGIEYKYKQLIKSIRKATKDSNGNCCMIKMNATNIDTVFSDNEISNVFIHFPDPWKKTRHLKFRLINKDFAYKVYRIQKKGSFIDIKTDSQDYFRNILLSFKDLSYDVQSWSTSMEDLSKIENNDNKFSNYTPFEKIFISKNEPVFYAHLTKQN